MALYKMSGMQGRHEGQIDAKWAAIKHVLKCNEKLAADEIDCKDIEAKTSGYHHSQFTKKVEGGPQAS